MPGRCKESRVPSIRKKIVRVFFRRFGYGPTPLLKRGSLLAKGGLGFLPKLERSLAEKATNRKTVLPNLLEGVGKKARVS